MIAALRVMSMKIRKSIFLIHALFFYDSDLILSARTAKSVNESKHFTDFLAS